jgi:uncharacterized DUF497 family protein
MENRLFDEVLREANESEYKDSDQACFEKELGNHKEDVTVIDKYNNKNFVFKWQRGKSNENIDDIGIGKRGFSFYLARYVFFDPYFLEDEALATDEKNTGIIGIIPGDKKEEKIIVINAIEENSGAIRIISAYYADNLKYQKYIDKYNRKKRHKQEYQKMGFLNGVILSEDMLLRLQEITEKLHSKID